MTGQPFPGNIITIPLNPAAVNYLNAYPAAQLHVPLNPNCHGIEQNYTVTRQRIQTINDFDVRGDWIIGKKDSAFFRYSYGNDNLTTTSRLPNLPAGFRIGHQPHQTVERGDGGDATFTPNLINDFRFGFIHTNFGYTPSVAEHSGVGQPRHRECQRQRRGTAGSRNSAAAR